MTTTEMFAQQAVDRVWADSGGGVTAPDSEFDYIFCFTMQVYKDFLHMFIGTHVALFNKCPHHIFPFLNFNSI